MSLGSIFKDVFEKVAARRRKDALEHARNDGVLGPTVGSLLTLSLTEGLRIGFGTQFIGAANTIYGILLILFIIFMPRGIVGVAQSVASRRKKTEGRNQKPEVAV